MGIPVVMVALAAKKVVAWQLYRYMSRVGWPLVYRRFLRMNKQVIPANHQEVTRKIVRNAIEMPRYMEPVHLAPELIKFRDVMVNWKVVPAPIGSILKRIDQKDLEKTLEYIKGFAVEKADTVMKSSIIKQLKKLP